MAPPRKGRKAQQEEPAAPAAIARPATPNDFRIVATVKALQGLANVETKWKNRLTVAGRDEVAIKNKIQRVHQLIALCRKGISQCTAAVDALVEDQFNMVSADPAQAALWQQGMPVLAPGAAKAAASAAPSKVSAKDKKASQKDLAAQKEAGSDSLFPPGYAADTDPALTALAPPGFFAMRSQQRSALRSMLHALYNVPRLGRERQVARPASPVDMQHEVEEATRLATPAAELLAMQHAHLEKQKAAKSAASKAAASPLGKSRKDKKGTTMDAQAMFDDATSVADSEVVQALTGDLSPSDCLALPTPRGLDSKVVHRVQLQRSRRLRLEASIQLFEAELPNLERRLRGVADMALVGRYSLDAVQPEVSRVAEEEQSLQRVRQAEDEAFQARRTASTPTAASPQGRRKGGNAAAASSSAAAAADV